MKGLNIPTTLRTLKILIPLLELNVIILNRAVLNPISIIRIRLTFIRVRVSKIVVKL